MGYQATACRLVPLFCSLPMSPCSDNLNWILCESVSAMVIIIDICCESIKVCTGLYSEGRASSTDFLCACSQDYAEIILAEIISENAVQQLLESSKHSRCHNAKPSSQQSTTLKKLLLLVLIYYSMDERSPICLLYI